MSPSGSKAATGLLDKCINPWQLGERRSHNRRVLSSEPERNMSSIGLMDKVTTLYLKRNKLNMFFINIKKLTYFLVCPGK